MPLTYGLPCEQVFFLLALLHVIYNRKWNVPVNAGRRNILDLLIMACDIINGVWRLVKYNSAVRYLTTHDSVMWH